MQELSPVATLRMVPHGNGQDVAPLRAEQRHRRFHQARVSGRPRCEGRLAAERARPFLRDSRRRRGAAALAGRLRDWLEMAAGICDRTAGRPDSCLSDPIQPLAGTLAELLEAHRSSTVETDRHHGFFRSSTTRPTISFTAPRVTPVNSPFRRRIPTGSKTSGSRKAA